MRFGTAARGWLATTPASSPSLTPRQTRRRRHRYARGRDVGRRWPRLPAPTARGRGLGDPSMGSLMRRRGGGHDRCSGIDDDPAVHGVVAGAAELMTYQQVVPGRLECRGELAYVARHDTRG